MCFFSSIRNMAGDLGAIYFCSKKRKGSRLCVAVLRFEAGPIDGTAIETRRRPGFQALPFAGPATAADRRARFEGASPLRPQLYFCSPTCARPFRNVPVVTTTAPLSMVRPSRNKTPVTRRGLSVRYLQLRDFGLQDPEIRLVFQDFAHAQAILFLIALGARRPDGWPAAGIQQAKLNPDGVRHLAHYAAHGVDFAHQMALGDSADGGVARHLGDQIQVHRDHRGLQAQARAGSRGFTARVSGADYNHVVTIRHFTLF